MTPAITGRLRLRRRWSSLALGVVAVAHLGFMTQAHGAFLAIGWSSTDSPIYRFDTPDGPPTLLSYSGYKALNSLAKAPGDKFYSAATNIDTSQDLILIDPQDGSTSLVTPISGTSSLRALATSLDGSLFGAAVNGKVFEINTLSGIATEVVSTPYVLIQGLAFSPTGVLYAWEGTAGLLTIDPAAHAFADVNPDIGGTLGIQTIYFTSDGQLRGARNSLYAIDLVTGEAAQLGLLGSGSLDIRGADEIAPEPASLVLMVGAATLYSRRRAGSIASRGTLSQHKQ